MNGIVNGILAGDNAFEVIAGGVAVGPRRHLDTTMVAVLIAFAERYAALADGAPVVGGRAADSFLQLGRDLYVWLDGADGQMDAVLQRAERPLRFAIAVPHRLPTPAEFALLRAPWELLADDNGFLAGDAQLGFSPLRRIGRPEDSPKPGSYRLGVVFMAAAPEGVRDLDYEGEETAIMRAVGERRRAGPASEPQLDLLVEESGNPDEMGQRLAECEPMQALHLSCHGDNAWPFKSGDKPRPALLLEDPEGRIQATDAAALIAALGSHRPSLVFLSACLTAAAGDAKRMTLPGGKDASGIRGAVAHSLAEALIGAGLPAVLGWDGSVRDDAAITFAAELYDRLEGRADLAGAVASARRALLNDPNEGKRADWHLARLWCGRQGGGALVGGNVRRRMMPANQGEKEFLAKVRQLVPVAAHGMFVGRRRELQKAQRALRDGRHAGVLIHGMGRLGKSSLAARIANRRRDLRLAVVFEHYGARDVLDALAEAFRDAPNARDALRAGIDLVRQNPDQSADRLEDVLTDLLTGPCGQHEPGGTPVLLVIDDLERTLDADPNGGPHRVKAENAKVLRAVLQAFDTARPDGGSRLIVTSRFRFALDGLEDCLFELPLPPLSDAAQRKLELRQKESAAGAGLAGKTLADRVELLARVPGIARGNPGLQDLIGRKLILSAAVTVERAQKALDDMAAWLARGALPAEPEVRAFLENLAVDALINFAGPEGSALLRRLTVFDLPVPEAVAQRLETRAPPSPASGGGSGRGNGEGYGAFNHPLPDPPPLAGEGMRPKPPSGGALQRLRDLGLVDVSAGLVDPGQTAVAANALAAGRLPPLSEAERTALAPEVAGPLFRAWGGFEGGDTRPSACDHELTRLGLLARDGEVVAGCAHLSLVLLNRSAAAAAAAEQGRAAIALLDHQQRPPPYRLLSETASAAATIGDGAAADALLERGYAALEVERKSGAAVDPVAASFLVYEHARRLVTRGRLDDAEPLFADAARFATQAGNEISATVARGAIADILQSRGQLDEALRIRKEEQLPVYERLGDVRSRAVTMGKIADILQSRGQLDEALRIRKEEEIPVYERLGDVRSRAVTMGKIADILQSRGQLDEALRIRKEEQLPVYERLGDVRERAVTMGKIADILQSRGQLDEALRIRKEEEIPVYERLGDVRSRAVTMGKIADILQSRGQLDEALRICKEEEIPVYERLGDVRSRAVTMGKIADILQSRGQLDEALRIRKEEEIPVYERLGDVRERAVTMGKIADILQSRGQLDEALRIRKEEQLPVYERLGDVRSRAVTMGQIADILRSRGQLDEALRIRKEEEIPVYERLGDVRSRAVTMGQIADILQSRGQLDEALRIRKEEQLPVYERLGDVRERAVTMGKIADILQSRGQLDEALRIRKEEQLPVYERLGDVRSRAVTMGKIAHVLAQNGDLAAARALQEERLDVNRRLGDADGIGTALWDLAHLDLAEEKIVDAVPRIVEAYGIMLQIADAEGIAVFGTLYAQILAAGDRREDALAVLRRSAEMYRLLGREADAEQAEALIRDLGLA